MSASTTQAAANESSGVLGSANATSTVAYGGPRPQFKMTSSGKTMEGSRKQNNSPIDGAQKKPITPRAWTQGTNPITQRSANQNITNGTVNNSRQAAIVPRTFGSVSKESGGSEKHAHDRLIYLIANFKGLMATLILKNGEQYRGVFSGAILEPSDLRYTLKMVKKVNSNTEQQSNGIVNTATEFLGVGDDHTMTFAVQDVAELAVSQLVIDRTQHKYNKGANTAFKTDADISSSGGVRERNLKRWEPSTTSNIDLSLEETGNSNWDQFEANERLYGIKSNYDEKFYTTTIDKSNPLYRQRAVAAEKLAREIEASSAMSSHVSEERSQTVLNDSGQDDEDKYSGVRRDFAPLVTRQSNTYTPPAKRAPTGQPTVLGAPVDPAIISSQLAPSDAANLKAQQQAGSSSKSEEDVNEVQQKPSEDNKMEQLKGNASKGVVRNTQPDQVLGGGNEKPTAPSAWKAPTSAANPGNAMTRAAKPDNVDLLDSFKQFSAQEKLRMAERQRSKVHADKAVKLNDLKKFSQNFKLHTPVPSDLVPILAKEKTKQEEIVERAIKNMQEIKAAPLKSIANSTDPKQSRTGHTRLENGHGLQAYQPDRASHRGRFPPQGSAIQPGRSDRYPQNQNMPPRNGPGLLSQRLAISQQQHKAGAGVVNIPPPVPLQNVRIPPTGPIPGPSSAIPTPSSAASSKFNVWATEFRPNPASSTFTPSADVSESSSPRLEPSTRSEPRKVKLTSFKDVKSPAQSTERRPIEEAFNPIKRMKNVVEEEKRTKEFASNGGIPQAYRTPPRWDVSEANREKSYADMFEKVPLSGQSISPSYTNVVNGSVPHQHQLPLHLQGGLPSVPQPGTPHHTPRHSSVQPHHGHNGPHHYEDSHRMQLSASTSSMHPSPRGMHPFIAYNPQIPHPVHIYPQAVPAFGMSPGGHPVALRHVPAGAQLIASQGPGMSGHMMTNQPSNGPYMGIPINPQMHMFSPTPAHAYPHHAGPQPGPPSSGYPSPRPAPMMSHQGSQQGHPPQPVVYLHPGAQGPAMLAQAPLGPMTPMRGSFPQHHQQAHYGTSPHQPHHYSPHQHRGTPSGGYAQPMIPSHTMSSHIPPQMGLGSHVQDTGEEVK